MTEIKKETAPPQSVSVPSIAEIDSSVNAVLDIDHWILTRQEFKTKVGTIMVESIDYSVIKDKKSLGKAGAEKIGSIFNWAASFTKDDETWEMLGKPAGILCYVCTLTERNTGKFVGQGRGARDVKKDAGDINKSIKMATKSAHIDAVIRASGLSDIFTQDLEDINPADVGKPFKTGYSQPRKATDKQKDFIVKLMNEKGYKLPDLIDEGFGEGSDPSELIEWLLAAKPRFVNGQEQLPTIDIDPVVQKELEDIGDSIQ